MLLILGCIFLQALACERDFPECPVRTVCASYLYRDCLRIALCGRVARVQTRGRKPQRMRARNRVQFIYTTIGSIYNVLTHILCTFLYTFKHEIQMSDFADATSTPANSSSSIVTPRASDNMRTLIDMHKKRVLPTPHLHQQPQSLQRNNGANAAELPSNSHSHLHGGGMDSATSSLPSPATTASSISAGNMHTQASGELSNLFGSLQAKKKSLQQHHHASAYTDRNNGNGPIVSSHAGGLAAARSASNLLNASSSNSSINQASTSTTSSQQVSGESDVL